MVGMVPKACRGEGQIAKGKEGGGGKTWAAGQETHGAALGTKEMGRGLATMTAVMSKTGGTPPVTLDQTCVREPPPPPPREGLDYDRHCRAAMRRDSGI